MGDAQIAKVNLSDALGRIAEPWQPRIAGELNGQHVKLAKMRGEFPWHAHDDADEMFFVLRGAFRLELRDRAIDVAEGEMVIVPRGIEHRPVAEREAHVLLFEPAGTVNTGALRNELTTSGERI
jgi:mannose-6-phosphate isomerase-like protein (cupin superfamily)